MNNITIAGQLGKDAEVKFLSNGDPVASFSVADSQGKDKPTIWWNCSLFGKRAESLTQYLTKGQSVTVIGQVTEREWTDKDGQKRKSMDVRVGDVALQGGKREESAAPRPAARPAPRTQEFSDIDQEIPF
jgi:single-strand DNA-binding protein